MFPRSIPRPSALLQSPDATRYLAYALLTLFTLIGWLLRAYGTQASLWVDELHTSWVVAGNLGQLPDRAALGNNHASYFYLPWLSTQVFGMQEWPLRLPSLLAGTALIPLTYVVTQGWSQTRLAALLGAGLATLDPWCVVFAQEARVYSVVQFVALLQILTLWQVIRRPSWQRRLALILVSIMLCYLHFTSGLLLLAEFVVFVAIRFWCSRPLIYTHRQLACDALLVLFGTSPTWPLLSDVWSRRTQWELFVQVPTSAQIVSLFPLELYVLAPLVLAGLGAAWCALAQRPNGGPQIRFGVWLFVSAWFVVPMAAAALLAWADVARVFHARYLISVALAPILFAALLCATCDRALRAAFASIMLLASLFTYGPIGQIRREGSLICHRREDWRGAIEWIRERGQPGDPLLFRSGLIEADNLNRLIDPRFAEYCQFPLSSIYPIDNLSLNVIILPTSNTAHALDGHLSNLSAQHQILLLIRGPERYAERLIRDAHRTHTEKGRLEQEHFAGVTAARITHRQPERLPGDSLRSLPDPIQGGADSLPETRRLVPPPTPGRWENDWLLVRIIHALSTAQRKAGKGVAEATPSPLSQ